MTGFKSKQAAAQAKLNEDDDIQDYKKPWVGLTRDEQSFVYQRLHNATSRINSFWVDFANAIETKLKEKNT
jgi:hypothetical protein